MQENLSELIGVNELRIGMFVELELGWMAHPFPTGSFRLASQRQIDIICGLGLTQVRYVPSKSDLAGIKAASTPPPTSQSPSADEQPLKADESLRRHELLQEQRRRLIVCERRFGEATHQHRQVMSMVQSQPQEAKEQCLQLIGGYVADMSNFGETSIRLLSQGASERVVLHPVNVTVLCLLLGRAMGLPQKDLVDLGVAAFLHDMGKQTIPERAHVFSPTFTNSEYRQYQDHVSESVTMATRMGLAEGALQAIACHHEMVDGSGFPLRLKGAEMSLSSKILALVNRYENLCNPSRPASALTPHEALALIFSQLKSRFDGMVMSAFIRMMGVYPPGSIVQLLDDRYAMVVSVNSSRPLKPCVLVHDPQIPPQERMILDLDKSPALGIRRSLKPAALPRKSLEYLMPRVRISYFFEKATDAIDTQSTKPSSN